MSKIFYCGEDIKVIVTSDIDISGYSKIAKFFTPFSAVFTAAVADIDSYTLSILLAKEDTILLSTGSLNIVLEFTDLITGKKKIGKLVQIEIVDPYKAGHKRDDSPMAANIVFYNAFDSVKINYVSDLAVVGAINAHIADKNNPHAVTKNQVGLADVNNTSDNDKPVSTAQQTALNNKENTGVAASLIDTLKDSVPTAGNTLKKLYNMFVAGSGSDIVANIAARDAYNIPSTLFQLFVQDDGDGKWALYLATSTGVGATFVKLSDPDLLNAVMSGSQIATAYESVSGVNRFTTALKTKLENLSANISLTFQYSVDGTTNWHSPATSSDAYFRMSTDSGATWGTALNYKGQRGDEDKTIQITSTAGTISANFASQINVCNDSGNIAVVPSFTNMPIYSCERLLIINNAGTASITIAMPTADLVVGNKTYKFVNMDTGTLTIPASKSAEFSFLILMTLTPNVFEVRIKNSIQS